MYEEDRFIIDGEWYVSDLRVTYGLSSSIIASVGLSGIVQTGGVLDRPIESFHNAMGLGNAGREEHPRDRFLIDMTGDDSRQYQYDRTGITLGDIPIYLAWYPGTIFEGGPDTVIAVGVTLPTGDRERLSGLGTPTYGAALLMRQTLGGSGFGIFGGGGFSYAKEVELMGNRLRRESVSAITGFSWRWRPGTFFSAQYMYTSAIARESPTFSKPTHEIHVGLRHQMGERVWFEAAFLENVFDFSNSMDVGFSLALSWQH